MTCKAGGLPSDITTYRSNRFRGGRGGLCGLALRSLLSDPPLTASIPAWRITARGAFPTRRLGAGDTLDEFEQGFGAERFW